MKNKVIWLLVSGWMVVALLVTSCAPAAVEEEEIVVPEEEVVVPPEEVITPPEEVVTPPEGPEMVKWRGTKLDGTVVERMLQKPRYGGIHTTARADQPVTFDDIVITGPGNWATHYTNETLRTRDWSRGPFGTNEWDPTNNVYPGFEVETDLGSVAEKWEVVKTDTSDDLVYHVRKGIYWHNKPPVNGRQLTADDVVFSLRRSWEVGYMGRVYRFLTDMENYENSIFVSPDDPWAVVMKCKPGEWGHPTLGATTTQTQIVAPEMILDYNKALSDWKMVCGTGPYILKDYVGGSALTYIRNPDYWGYDPLFPENRLPYVDTFKMLVIPDLSTRLTALRTGKVDNLYNLSIEDAKTLMKTSPELESHNYLGTGVALYPRLDKPELPFNDIRVRRALMMAINFQEIKDEYYEGKAALFYFPIAPVLEYMDFYIPLEEMPESVQELYGYHPNKARQLLAEAGYSDGFKTEILCEPSQIDVLSIVKEYWAHIGVDLKLEVRDVSVYSASRSVFAKRWSEMIASGTPGKIISTMTYTKPGGVNNRSIILDPELGELYQALGRNYNMASIGKLYTTPTEARPDMVTYANEQAWIVCLPTPNNYAFWQPWLKNYGGAIYVTFWGYDYADYVWIDQKLKETMVR